MSFFFCILHSFKKNLDFSMFIFLDRTISKRTIIKLVSLMSMSFNLIFILAVHLNLIL